jgi:phage-related holin
MKEILAVIQMGFAAVGGFLGWFLCRMNGLIYALIAFVVVDYITGIMRAILEKDLSSRIGARGIFKKILIFLLVGIGHLADAGQFTGLSGYSAMATRCGRRCCFSICQTGASRCSKTQRPSACRCRKN